MCRLFETIRICDGIPQHLEWHEKRMERSGKILWGKEWKISLKEMICIPDGLQKGIIRCNVYYDLGLPEFRYTPWIRNNIRSLKLVYDNTIEYAHKYQDRSRLEELMAQKEDCDEILIVKNGFITDTSISNVILYDGKNWYTPDTPLLAGTTRQRLLAENKILPGTIRPRDLGSFLGLKMINAMRLPEEEDFIPVNSLR